VAAGDPLTREDEWGTVADVSIDPDYCIGSGDCVRVMPEAFELRDELGVSVPLPAAAQADLGRLLQVARACPTQAIRVVGPDGTVLHESNGG
jgi:ferredoxin